VSRLRAGEAKAAPGPALEPGPAVALRPHRFLEAFEEAGDAIVLTGPDGGLHANRAALELLGYSAEALAGTSLDALIAPSDLRVRPFDLEGAREGRTLLNLRTLLRKDGSRVLVETTSRALPSGGMVIVLRDVGSREREAVQLRLLQDAAVAANEATDLASASATCLERLCETLGFAAGHGWALAEEDGVFVSTRLWCSGNDGRLDAFRAATERMGFRRGDGSLPARVLAARRPVHVKDVREDPAFQRAAAARAAGLAGAVALPVLAHGEVVAVLELFWSETRDPEPGLTTLLTHVGTLLGRTAERERATAALERVQTRLDLALRAARAGTWEVDLDEIRPSCDERLTELFGLPPGTSVDPVEVVHPDDRERIEADLKRLGGAGDEFSTEYRVRRGDGSVGWFQSQGRVRVEADGSRRVVGVSWDVTDRREVEARLRSLALFDSLTGLPNRRALEARLAEAQEEAAQRGEKLALLLLDLDGFGHVNESFGRRAGDALLCGVVERLAAATRDVDRLVRMAGPAERAGIARVGGDEFALVLGHLSEPEHAARLARDLLEAIAPPFQIGGAEIYGNASIGIAVAPDDGVDAETLIQSADAALRAEKRELRGSYRFYDASLNATALRRLEVEAAVRSALRDDRFRLFYQPLVDARSGRILGAEALVRLPRPEGGYVSPAEFIPVAEETGLIPAVGEWVLREATRQGAAWQAAGRDLELSVNLSSVQLRTRGIADVVRRILAESGFPPSRLVLEITESAVLEDEGLAVESIREIRAQGVHIALDDFGTGHSSLTRLHRLPLDRLKLDRAFVRDVANDEKVALLTQTILALTKSLGLISVGEGVETDEHADFLIEHGCDELQGYLFAAPAPAEDFERLHDHGIRRKRAAGGGAGPA